MIRAILHADRKWGIGKNNSLLFSLPRDMKFFRETTSGKTVVMGGNTLRSFPGGKPLKNRTNIVLSATQVRDDCIVVRTLDELKAEMKGMYLFVKSRNRAAGSHALRKRRKGRGYGTQILQELAENYEGTYQADYEKGWYTAAVMVKAG